VGQRLVQVDDLRAEHDAEPGFAVAAKGYEFHV
jgi:hypothetical protein